VAIYPEHTEDARVWMVRLWRIHGQEECLLPAIVGSWPSTELPKNDRKGRFRGKTGPDEPSGRTAACGPWLCENAKG